MNAFHLVSKARHKQRSDCFLLPLVKKERVKSMKNLGENSKSRERLEKNFDIFYKRFLYFY